jgi:hypothetical protein
VSPGRLLAGGLALTAALAGAGFARAEPVAAVAPGELAAACQLDVQLFCAGLAPEAPRDEVLACLEKSLATLTEECRAVVDPASVPRVPAADPLEAACGADFRRLCGRSADRMEFTRCVRAHRHLLPAACQDALDALRPGAGSSPSLP